MDKGTYYKIWALCQKQDVCFFTYSEKVQNLIIIYTYLSIAFKVIDLLQQTIKK